MNNEGQTTVLGFAFITVFLVIALITFALIEPFKESLDENRDADSLNCPGTDDFNQTDYDLQNDLERLTFRPTCFVTGISMVWFVSTVLIMGLIWVTNNWRKIRRKS